MTNPQCLDWATKQEIGELVARYFQLVDDKEFSLEKLSTVFTLDGTLKRPNGATVSGPAEIAASNAESFSRFRATQHFVGGCVVEVNGERATGRVNVMAMHLWADGYGDPNSLDRHFVGGIVLTVNARRSENVWRLESMEGRNVWRAGSTLGMMVRNQGEGLSRR